MLRKLALAYAVVVSALAVWTWAVEIAYFGSDQEHLYPVILLDLWSLPTSLIAVDVLCTPANDYCGKYGQYVLITVCGGAQAIALLMVVHWWKTRIGRRVRR